MLNVSEFIERKIFGILGAVGALSLFHGIFNVAGSITELNFTPRDTYLYAPVVFGILICALGITGLMGFFSPACKKIKVPKFLTKGKWVYEVYKPTGSLSHKGTCEIRKDGSQLKFYGERHVVSSRDGANRFVKTIWESKWGQFCADGMMRFEYDISIEGHRIQAYCKAWMENETSRFKGEYNLLHPHPPDIRNAMHGTIVFKRDDGQQNLLVGEVQKKNNVSVVTEESKDSLTLH